ncbi:MAG: hypothetical protein ACK5JH_03495 [Anaerocolumna sp.]
MSNEMNKRYNAIIKINTITDLFYQQKNDDGIKLLEKLFEDLIGAIEEVYKIKAIENNKEELEVQFNLMLTKAMEHLEKNDMILFADILNYELKVFLLEHS